MASELASIGDTASKYRALPLVCHVLGKESHDLPDTLRSSWRAQYLKNYLTTTRLLKELKQLLVILKHNNIEVLILKGAALATTVYKDPGLRPMRDIDILVNREDLPRLADILSNCDYDRYSPPASIEMERFHGEVAYVKRAQADLLIEPHWTLGPEYPYAGRIKIEEFRLRAKEIDIEGIKTHTLCPEDFIIHTCLHLVNHSQDNWIVPACDIATIANYYETELDWHSLLDRVWHCRLCLPVQYCLTKTVELFHPAIPFFVVRELSSYKPGFTERTLFVFLTEMSSTAEVRYFAGLITMPGIKQKLHYFWSLLFPSRAWLMSQYHGVGATKIGLHVYHLKSVFTISLTILIRFLSRRHVSNA